MAKNGWKFVKKGENGPKKKGKSRKNTEESHFMISFTKILEMER